MKHKLKFILAIPTLALLMAFGSVTPGGDQLFAEIGAEEAAVQPAAASDGGCWHGNYASRTTHYTSTGNKYWKVRLVAYIACNPYSGITLGNEPSMHISKSHSNVVSKTVTKSGVRLYRTIATKYFYSGNRYGTVCGNYSAFGMTVTGDFYTFWGNGPGHEKQKCRSAWLS